jgi:hypothetical protein
LRCTWLALPALLLAIASVTSARVPAADAHALGPVGTLSIINPAGLEGPAGTNLTVQLTGAAKDQTYSFAYEPSSMGCPVLGAAAPTIPQQTTDGNGSVQFSFAWPADSGTGTFYLCAQPQSAALPVLVIQSQKPFTVDSATAPAVTIEPAPTATPTGTVSADTTPTSQNSYTTGEGVVVHGTGFLPPGTPIQIALASSASGGGTVISQDTVNTDRMGNFDTTVTLPTYRIGDTLYIQAETTDGGNNQPPSLLASTPIKISLPPTATPTPTPTATATAGPTPTPYNPGSSGPDSTLRFFGIAGLGSLSLLLLLIGTALLISAGSSRSGMG